MSSGTLYWITGLSGAGKTTIGTTLYSKLKSEKDAVVLLDGDTIREVYGTDDYSIEGRKKWTKVHSRLCRLLTNQGIDVVSCNISMFEECREWNRNNIMNYVEIYLKVGIDVLCERDAKGIYAKAMHGELKNVMGVDLPFEEPQHPDIIVENDGRYSPEDVIAKIIECNNQKRRSVL